MIKINDKLTLEELVQVARFGDKVELSEQAKKRILKSRSRVEEIIKSGQVVYGINTGFGEFANKVIEADKLKELQRNLIVSHSVAVGAHLPIDIVRAMMLLRVQSLSFGYSGVRLELIQTFVDMLNAGITPAVPEKGSLGASGDLAPLSHMALPLIGLGEVYFDGKIMAGAEAMKLADIVPLELVEKEGLALINGTQMMCAIGALTIWDTLALKKEADIAAALTMEALNGITDAFSEELHSIRPHAGQKETAKAILNLLEKSERITKQGEIRVQDAYGIRCIPQVHGASLDAINYAKNIIEIEMNSVTDNPIILEDGAISGGHFHGQPLALALDFLAIAIAELGNISERRIERLVNSDLNKKVLPPFLVKEGGLNSGFMIAQYTAASLVSENKVLCHPASVDSIPSSMGQEDHVSMGSISARKSMEVYYNSSRVIAIEMLAAAQAIDLSQIQKPLGKGTALAYEAIRNIIKPLENDREMYYDINKASYLIDSKIILNAVYGE
ncbi:MAG: histidine ammonia-lyase [Defluviitaleaceae bacterium]|nr:histidine ammonia-lyase [Defluviitaleaceae bacterium]